MNTNNIKSYIGEEPWGFYWVIVNNGIEEQGPFFRTKKECQYDLDINIQLLNDYIDNFVG